MGTQGGPTGNVGMYVGREMLASVHEDRRDDYLRLVEEIIARVRKRNPDTRIVLAGMRLPPELGPAHAEAFGRVFPEVAKSTGATLVPFLLDGVGGVTELNQADRIHPNPAGHAIMAETVWKVLRPLL